MIVAGLMAFAAAAALQAQPLSVRTSAASLSVGATVIRHEPQPAVAVRSGAIIVSNAGGVTVSADGGTARRLDGETILVTPGGAGPVTLTVTY